MFISDIKYQEQPGQHPLLFSLNKKGAPYFASVLGRQEVEILEKLEQIILDDPTNRGVAHLFVKSDFIKAVLTLSHSERVAITTGFPANVSYAVKEETDGLPGALSIARALLALEKEVTIISDQRSKALYTSCISHVVDTGGLQSHIPVIQYTEAKALFDSAEAASPFDCLLAIERSGRASDGAHYSMHAVDVSQYVDPVDDLFQRVQTDQLVATIGVGDGGNEVGMGKVLEQVKQHIPLGEKVACVTPADFLIAAGVSNWAGYALSVGLFVASRSPMHWRYRHRGINAETPPDFSVSEFLPSPLHVSGYSVFVHA